MCTFIFNWVRREVMWKQIRDVKNSLRVSPKNSWSGNFLWTSARSLVLASLLSEGNLMTTTLGIIEFHVLDPKVLLPAFLYRYYEIELRIVCAFVLLSCK